MKKFISFILIVVLSMPIFAGDNTKCCYYPVGKDINVILVDAPVRVAIYKGDCTGIRLVGDTRLMKQVRCVVSDGKLIIKTTKDGKYLLDEDNNLQIFVVTPKECLKVEPKTRGYKIQKKNGNHGKK